jgi:hypothetical protein
MLELVEVQLPKIIFSLDICMRLEYCKYKVLSSDEASSLDHAQFDIRLQWQDF